MQTLSNICDIEIKIKTCVNDNVRKVDWHSCLILIGFAYIHVEVARIFYNPIIDVHRTKIKFS